MSCLILHGRRLLHLQKWRYHLGVSVNPLHNAFWFSSAADLSGRKEKIFTVSYLVGSVGLAPKLAESISKRISFKEKGNPDSVLSLLRRYGFVDSQISTIVTAYPGLLVLDAEKSIAPKLQFLLSTKGAEFPDIVSNVPKLLGMKLDKNVSRYYDFVKELVEADKSCSKLSPCISQGSEQENKMRNIWSLRELGVPLKFLFPLLISNHYFLYKKERFGESVNKVVEMGFDPTTSKFLQALEIVCGCSDKNIQEKVQVYKRFGFTADDVWAMFKYFPQCLGYSAESVKRKIQFVVKEMNWPLKDVTMFPQVLGYSMEKRIVPRCEIIKALLSKGLLGNELPSMALVLNRTDEVFLERYVRNHDDKQLVLELMAIFTKTRVS